MKFGTKLILCVIAIMACILSFSRYFIIRQSFMHSIEKSASQNLNHHMAQRYYLESNIIGNIKHGEEITDENIIEHVESLYSYLGESEEMLVLYDDKQNIIFSNFDDIDKMKLNIMPSNEANSYYIGKTESKHYMLFPSYLAINNKILNIINIYDVTDIYEERERQLKEVAFSDIIILGVASIFIAIFSKFLTDPIKKLNDKAKRISKGEFSNRVNIKSSDEIGELADSFNVMSEEIENKINSLNLSIKQKDDFINAFTHEIKTPMTAIIGYSDMLRLKKCDEELTRKSLNYIYSEAKRLEVLSHKLMNLMSLSEDRLELEIINVKEYMERMLEGLNTGEKIIIKGEFEPSYVMADKDLLKSIIKNLIENAKKSDPKDNLVFVKRRSDKESEGIKYQLLTEEKAFQRSI